MGCGLTGRGRLKVGDFCCVGSEAWTGGQLVEVRMRDGDGKREWGEGKGLDSLPSANASSNPLSQPYSPLYPNCSFPTLLLSLVPTSPLFILGLLYILFRSHSMLFRSHYIILVKLCTI